MLLFALGWLVGVVLTVIAVVALALHVHDRQMASHVAGDGIRAVVPPPTHDEVLILSGGQAYRVPAGTPTQC